jgi:hypothetical protein
MIGARSFGLTSSVLSGSDEPRKILPRKEGCDTGRSERCTTGREQAS